MSPLRDGDEIPDYPWLPKYLRVPGARYVETAANVLVAEAVADVSEDFGIAVVYGEPGNGKTFAVRIAAEQRATLPVTVHVPANKPTMRALVEGMVKTLGAEPSRSGRRTDLDPLHELLETPRLIVIDEVQRLDRESIDSIRSFSDRPETNVAFVLAGGHQCLRALSTEAQLDRRAPLKTQFLPLEPDEVADHIRRYHPIYEQATDGDIDYLNSRYGHGNLGRWANATKHATKRMSRLKRPIDGTVPITRDVIDFVLRRFDIF